MLICNPTLFQENLGIYMQIGQSKSVKNAETDLGNLPELKPSSCVHSTYMEQ